MRRTLWIALLQVVAHSFAPRGLRPLHKHNTATQSCTRRRRRLSATNEELLNAIQALTKRIDSLAADVEQLKSARVDGLEAELERLRTSPPASTMTTAEALLTPPEPRPSARTAPGLNAALSARAALGAHEIRATLPVPRFKVGARVECLVEAKFLEGTVVRHHYRESDWEPDVFAPYQVKLDGQSPGLIYARWDEDDCIRAAGADSDAETI